MSLIACEKKHRGAAGSTASASLSALSLSDGQLNPAFDPAVNSYSTMFLGANSLTVTPTAEAGSTITVNGTPVVSGQPSGAITLPPGTSTITITVTDSLGSTAYTLTVHRLAQEAYAKASNTGASDQFGYSVALDGDTLAVGATQEDSNGTGINSGAEADNSAANSGAVYVFTRSAGTWTQQAYIKASNTGANDNFGYSLALAGDTLAVGAYAESSNGTGVNSGAEADNSLSASGAVYVFTRSAGTWTQQAYVKASNTEAFDSFGIGVALDGETLAVGAHFEDSNGTGVNSGAQADNSSTYSGAAYLFTRSAGVWTQQAYVKASNTGNLDHFGTSVALDGDTLAAGALDERSNGTGVNSGAEADNSFTDSGAVYVFQ